jgi:tetratricopeptide (TPR) repeat protein
MKAMKNTQKIFILIVVLSTFIITSCKKWIDFEPMTEINSKVALTSTYGLQTALIGAYDRLQGGDLYGGEIWTAGDMIAYNVKKSGEYALVYEEIQMFNKQMSPDNRITVSMWMNGYWAINEVNTVLEAIPNVKDDQIATEKDRITGECLFIRALMHYDLMRYFQNLHTGEGVPLLTRTYGIDEYPARADTAAIYNQVIEDLTQAYSLLPATNNDRATKWAAKALLARVYFYHGQYQEAADAATEVIESGQFQMVQDSLIRNYRPALSEEVIFAVMGRVGDQTAGTLNGFFRKVPGASPKFIFSNQLIKYFTLTSGYSDTIADKRYNELAFNQDGKIYASKFNDRYMSVPLLRLAEMYLTRSECRFRLNDMAGAIEDMNVIRNRAHCKPFVGTMNANDIYYERAKELFYEGDDFHNRRRLHKSVKDPNPNNPVEYVWDDYSLMFKIPDREIVVNPNLTQNQP